MTDHHEVYDQSATQYDELVSREDAQGNILPALTRITPFADKDVVEFGAGTGRLTCLLAHNVRSIQAFDVSQPMLDIAIKKLEDANPAAQWRVAAGDHRALPAANTCADIAISGWSICYLAAWGSADWQVDVEKALSEMARVLHPCGVSILLEMLGTGFETPHPPPHLADYFELLDRAGFTHIWIRTDFAFQSMEEASRLVSFFFGPELARQIIQSGSTDLPECTGIWWKRIE